MIERQPGLPERFELRANLFRELAPHLRHKKEAHACTDEVAIELVVPSDETVHRCARQNGTPVDQHQMQPDVQIRASSGPRHCIGSGVATNHQARS
jgi:hypothetical protein